MLCVMQSASVAEQDPETHRGLAVAAYAAIDKLTSGAYTTVDHHLAVKLNTFACILAVEMWPALDEESRATVADHHDATVQAAEALHNIGQRYGRTGRFGATGNELSVIRRSFSLMDTLVGYANRGETIRAMEKMEDLIAAKKAELRRAAA